jgi:copper type II ascorbate-dependent monooxygenase-like protein
MQTQVFNLSCSSDSCHSSVGRAGDLILQDGYSWDSLVNHRPSNPVAAAEGLMRVMPGNADMSLLMAKISSNLQAGEGQSMPYNSAPLSTDTIGVMEAWINAGAPKDGMVPGDDGRALGDSGDPSGPFSLQPPEHGAQIKTTSPPVPIGKEETGCHYLKLPSDVDLDVNRIQVAVTGGSHHIHLYRPYDQTLDLPDGYEVCNHAVDFDVWELVVAVQLRRTDWELPPGVAFHFRKGEQLLVQTHFVNVGALETQGEGIAIMNLQAADPGTVTDHAGAIFGQDKDVDVLPHSSPTMSAECVFPKALNLIGETGHYHFRGRHFSTYLWNGGVRGDKIYDYDGYNDPPFKVHDPAIEFAAGGALQWECHWVNDTGNEFKFGPFTDTNEHCNWFGFYYPTDAPDESITCVKKDGVSTTTVRAAE